MIRKSMICVALASMALATSCSQDDMTNGCALSNSPIKMNTSFKLPTRAVETTISNLGSFSANAFQAGQSNYMTDVKYTSTDGSAWTTTAGTFFWPVSGDLHIYCYAPDQPGQSGTYTINKDSQTLTDFTPNTAAADQKDFVYAKSTGNNAQNGSAGIDVDFQHALSEITIAAKNSNTAYKVEVTGVKLGNIVNKGTFTFPSVSDAPASWTLSSTASDIQDYTTTWSSPFTLGADATTMDAANVPFMIIPQQLEKADKASEKAYIAVKVKITMQGGQVIHNDWAYVGIDTNWEMGMRYAYTLDFSTGAGQDNNGNPIISGTAVKFNCNVTPWDETIEEPFNPNPVQVSLTSANSLIVNPTSNNVYGINIVDKINKFWSSSIGDQTTPITTATEWEAEVIWQDIPSRAINFCTKNGSIIEGDKFTGQGIKPLYIKSSQNVSGNVVIGVKKKGASDYLWSWHLWLTNYNPSITAEAGNGQYECAVPNGYVHRYGGTVWDSDYKNKYIMDRNLGAVSSTSSDDMKTYGMYYQFGRKDPFPRGLRAAGVYDINGVVVESSSDKRPFSISGSTTFAHAVQAPYAFYCGTNGAWVSSNEFYSNIWNDPFGNTEKSFFDPCPEGWRVPKTRDIWENFTIGKSSPSETGVDVNPVSNVWAYYPMSSYLDSSKSGSVSSGIFNGRYWAATSNNSGDASSAQCLFYMFTTVRGLSYTGTGTTMSNGLSVRCIQE